MPSDRKFLIWALRACAAISLVTALRVVALYWFDTANIFLRIKSSIWVALAWDAAHGELYRPLFDANGYGGTRYMPLLFVVHAMGIRAGVDPIWSGVALMQASVAAVAVALFGALRSFRVPREMAACLAATVWGSIIFQQSCTDLNPDYLAAALALGAAVVTLGGERNWRRIAGGAALIVAAALTKVTAIAFAAPVAAALLRERRATAATFLTLAAAGAAGCVVVVDAASGGNFRESFLATASNGMTLSDVWRAVPKFGFELAIKPFDVAVPFAVACWCACTRRERQWPVDYLLTAAVVTIVIFASPGTASNHLVDLQVASTLVLGVAIARAIVPERLAAGLYAALAGVLILVTIPVAGLPSVVGEVRSAMSRPRSAVEAIGRDLRDGAAPYLSIDPIVPILNGDRPWLLDYAGLERAYVSGTAIGLDFASRIQQRFFAAVIVPRGYDSPIMPLLRTAYDVRESSGPFVVMRPRCPVHTDSCVPE